MIENESQGYWPSILSSMRLSRANVFGTSDEQTPMSEASDAQVPQIGFIGANYRKGGDVLLGINPGGGGDGYRATLADAILLPLIAEMVRTGPTVRGAHDVFRQYARNMRTWNLWRIVAPVLDACGSHQEDIAYLNWCPFRTRSDKMPRASAMVQCHKEHVAPLIKELAPTRVIALGMKVGDWLVRMSFPDVQGFVVPRTIGDSYLSDKALAALAELRRSTSMRVLP